MQTPATPASTQAPATAQAPVLTIEKGRLKDLFLPSYRAKVKAADELFKLYCARKKDSPAREALLEGCVALKIRAGQDFNVIKERGGLLLIGGAA